MSAGGGPRAGGGWGGQVRDHTERLVASCYDWDFAAAHDKMGAVAVPVADLIHAVRAPACSPLAFTAVCCPRRQRPPTNGPQQLEACLTRLVRVPPRLAGLRRSRKDKRLGPQALRQRARFRVIADPSRQSP